MEPLRFKQEQARAKQNAAALSDGRAFVSSFGNA
jgi:hypothetical protein